MSYKPPFFWLHVKKSGGSTARRLLQPYYVSLESQSRCPSFIQSPPEYWNDILNNSRMMLGEYQFRRSLFAKIYLYPGNWDHLFSFAFSREPVSRAVSMFYYLFFKNNKWDSPGIAERMILTLKYRKPLFDTSSIFDTFLDAVEGTHDGNIHISRHFAAHTAPMFPDIADNEGNIILSHIYRLECMEKAIDDIFMELGLTSQPRPAETYNKNSQKGSFVPNKKQHKRIEDLYAKDYEVYEKARLA